MRGRGVSFTVSSLDSSLDDSSIWVWGHRYLSSKTEQMIDSVMSLGVSKIDSKCVHIPGQAFLSHTYCGRVKINLVF